MQIPCRTEAPDILFAARYKRIDFTGWLKQGKHKTDQIIEAGWVKRAFSIQRMRTILAIKKSPFLLPSRKRKKKKGSTHF